MTPTHTNKIALYLKIRQISPNEALLKTNSPNGVVLKQFTQGGAIFHVPCMNYKANRHCQWRVHCETATWQGNHQS